MAECYKCGISDERVRMFSAISPKGVVSICGNCAREERLPLVQSVDLTKPEKTSSVYERLSRMAHLNPEMQKKTLLDKEREDTAKKKKLEMERRQGATLNHLIDKNIENKKIQKRTDLVDNFHWILMRARRAKKLTQKQLADNIGESESAIKRAEEGVVLNNADILIRKLENYLCVRIRKEENPYSLDSTKFRGEDEDPVKKEIKERFEKDVNFDYATTQNLTISDLQEMKRRREEKEKPRSEKVLSDEEIDDILFGK